MVLFPVLGAMAMLALLVPFVAPRLGRDTGYLLAAGFAALWVVMLPAAAGAIRGDNVNEVLNWLPALDVSARLRLDGLAALFALLVLGVGALIMAYCPRYLRGDHHLRTYLLLTLFAAAMLGLVLAADVVLLFVFWELTTISSFFLIGGTGPRSGQPAPRACVITGVGGLALLVAGRLISVTAGTTDLTVVLADPDVILDSPMAWPVGVLIVIAAFTKSAQLPFQSWLPGAMVAITPVSAYLHAATMVKAGLYLLMRFSPVYAGQPAWQATLIAVGLATAVVGAASALRQYDLKALLAYSTVSQLGLLVAVTGVGTADALAAAVVHTFAHALFKATLFMLVGIIDREAGSRDVRELGGLRRVMPVTATLTALASLSMAGVPPLIGFVSKESIFQGLAQADVTDWAGPAAAGLGVAASALTFGYSVRIFRGAFAGPTTQRRLYEPAWAFLTPAAVPALLGLILGPAVVVLNPLTHAAVQDMAPGEAAPRLMFWHGLSPELLLSLLTYTIGTGLFLTRRQGERVLQAIRIPAEGDLYNWGHDALVNLGAAVARPARSNSPTAYLVWQVGAVVGLGAVALVAAGGVSGPGPGTSRPLDWAVVGLLTVATAALMSIRAGLPAIALTGVTGLLVTAWFLLAGALDVAFTLLLVEVLTAVVAMLVLRTVPAQFHRPPPRRAMPTAALAIAAGVAAAGGTLALTGHRSRSALGEYLLREAEALTGGTDVVNTVLVDFRALDTLGEVTVLGAATVGLLLLLGRFRSTAVATMPSPQRPQARPRRSDRLVYQVTARLIIPGTLLLSAYLFLRGHYAPGGGFIAALVAGLTVAYGWIAEGRTGGTVPVLRALRPAPLVAAGLSICLLFSLLPLLTGQPLLTPLHLTVVGFKVSSSLGFDLGVYLIVLGLIVAAVDRLGSPSGPDTANQAPGARRPVPDGAPGGAGAHRRVPGRSA